MDKTNAEQLSLFDQNVEEDKQITSLHLASALPESATAEWKRLYAAISKYAKALKPQISND